MNCKLVAVGSIALVFCSSLDLFELGGFTDDFRCLCIFVLDFGYFLLSFIFIIQQNVFELLAIVRWKKYIPQNLHMWSHWVLFLL